MPMTVHEPRRIHWRAADIPPLFREGCLVQTLLVAAVGLTVFGVIAFALKLRASQVPDQLSPEVLMRINTDYSELPQ
jgi:hypothetical protein